MWSYLVVKPTLKISLHSLINTTIEIELHFPLLQWYKWVYCYVNCPKLKDLTYNNIAHQQQTSLVGYFVGTVCHKLVFYHQRVKFYNNVSAITAVIMIFTVISYQVHTVCLMSNVQV